MILTDTHVHLGKEPLDSEFYLRGAAAGVPRWVVCSSGLPDARNAQHFAEVHDGVFFTAGVHPHESASEPRGVAPYRDFAAHPKFVGIGEIGLDFYYDHSDRNVQRAVLADFLDLALELHRPAILHCRDKDGHDDAYKILFDLLTPFAERGGTFELHAFAGTPDWGRSFARLGAFFGVGGMVTFKRADNIRETVRSLPLDRILLETDTPYLAPIPHRGNPNHPAMIPLIANALATLFGVSPDIIARETNGNAERLFSLPPLREVFA